MIRAAALALALIWAPAALAQEEDAEVPRACPGWTAQMEADEGGDVFMASACAEDRPDAYLLMSCADGRVFMRYDLAAGAGRLPDLEEKAGVDFTVDRSTQRVVMQYEEMDGMFAGEVPANGPLMALMAAGESLRIADGRGIYPPHVFQLTGSSRALKALLARCD